MSRSKTDILKELLFEIDKICKENDLTYTLTDEIVQHIVEEERLPDEINHLSIAMTMGDIEKLIQIVNENKENKRQVEYLLNNPYATGMHIRYYNRETTLINLREFGYHVNYGFYISIIPIVKLTKGRRVKLLTLFSKIWKKSGESLRSCPYRDIAFVMLSKSLVSIIGRKRAAKILYRYNRKLRYIDRWKDIAAYRKIRIGRARFNGDNNWDLKTVHVESRELLFTKCVLNKQIYRAQSMNALKNNIESVEVPFQEAFEKYALSEKLYQIKKMRERYIKLMRKSKKANQCIDDAWNLYLMTHDIVGLKRYYDKEHILELKEALYGQNYKFYETAITPYRENKAYWTSMGVPFLEIPELEEILLLEKKYL